ncbi:hypothetical protein [Paenibacillus luteus]|uniref:hypothetical protein n=1 Tax=Paenibacillus luteus TaxID=2545753 RepID=UPI0019D59BA7|nr:hypothetical protein [Paenibacillus luteus]
MNGHLLAGRHNAEHAELNVVDRSAAENGTRMEFEQIAEERGLYDQAAARIK